MKNVSRSEKPGEVRRRARRSRAWVAVMAGVSEPTAKLYETDPDAVATPQKREALERVYARLGAENGGWRSGDA